MRRFAVGALLLALALTARAQDVQMNTPDTALPNGDNYTSQSETCHTRTANVMIAAWNDTSELGTLGAMFQSLTGWGYTTDGINFTPAGTLPPPSGWKFESDPAVAAATDGTIYMAALMTNDNKATVKALGVAQSTSNVAPITFGTPVVLNVADPTLQVDKELMAVDTSGGPFDGRVYVALDQGTPGDTQILVTSSTSQSPLAFAPWQAVTPLHDAHYSGAMPVVGPDGTAYLVWARYELQFDTTVGMKFQIVKSTDGGMSWINPDPADANPAKTITGAIPPTRDFLLGPNNSIVRTTDFPNLGVDTTPAGSPTRGNLYLVFEGDEDGLPNSGDNFDIFFSRSTNGGKTWSAPRNIVSGLAATVGRDTTQNDNFMPSITVSPVNGHIHVMFYDRRDDPQNMKVRRYEAFSTDGGLTWNNQPLSNTSFIPAVGYDMTAKSYFTDYNWSSSDANGIVMTWTDSRNHCTPPAGAPNPCSPSGRGDQDVFFQNKANLSGADLFIQPWGAITGVGAKWSTPYIFCVNDQQLKVNAFKGIINHLRGRVRNIGNAAASAVKVKFEYAPWFTGIADSDFKSVGAAVSADFTEAGGGNDDQTLAIEWDLTDLNDTNNGKWPAPISQFDHFCVKVTVTFAGDINLSNNIAQSNFFDVKTTQKKMKFLIGNPLERAALIQVVTGGLPPGFRASVDLADATADSNLSRGVRFTGNQLRIGEVTFFAPPQYHGLADVVADINMLVDGKLAGGISARLYQAPVRDVTDGSLGNFTRRIDTMPPHAVVTPTPHARPVNEPPLLTIPAGVRYRRTFDASVAEVIRAIKASEAERNEPLAFVDERRGLINTKSIDLTHALLIRNSDPTERFAIVAESNGRFLASFYVQPAERGTIVGVATLMIVNDDHDAGMLGGSRIDSNGNIETARLDAIASFLH